MELVDRYVHAVKRHLPAAQQEDIASELSDDILSQIRDQEAALGRPLTGAEQEAVLKRYGHPYALAMRYQPQRQLIGPRMFPIYWPTLKVAMGVALAIHLVVAVGTSLGQGVPERILPRVLGFSGVAIQVFGWVTLAFAAMDLWRGKLRILEDWSPRTLPAVTRKAPAVNRTGLVGELAGGVLFLAWWLLVPAYPFLMLGPAASFLTLSPAFERIHFAAILPGVVSIVLLAVTLVMPTWRLLAKVRPLVVNLASLFVLSMLLNAGDFLMPAGDSADAAAMVRGLNNGIHVVLAIVSIVTVLQTLHAVICLVRDARA